MTPNLDLPVFNLKVLKQYFYYFVAALLLITATSFLLTGLIQHTQWYGALQKINTWMLFLVLIAASFWYTSRSKAELKKINETGDMEAKFRKYESFYKKRLIYNAVSVGFSGLLFIITQKNVFFYIIIFQLLLSFLMYPRRQTIARELQNDNIIFTG